MYLCVNMPVDSVMLINWTQICDVHLFLFIQKRDDRLATLIKTSSVSNENKDKWKEILTIDFMSSEESGVEENSDGSERHVLNVSDLHWRAENVTSFLHRLDDKRAKKKSKKSEMQTRPRVNTGISDRCKPQTFPDNHWAFKK